MWSCTTTPSIRLYGLHRYNCTLILPLFILSLYFNTELKRNFRISRDVFCDNPCCNYILFTRNMTHTVNIISRNVVLILLISVPWASATAPKTRHEAQQTSGCVWLTVPYGKWVNWVPAAKGTQWPYWKFRPDRPTRNLSCHVCTGNSLWSTSQFY